MKLESLLTMLVVLGGTSLLARLLTQSVELPVATTVIEGSAQRAKALRRRWNPVR